MGLSYGDAATVTALVRHHLLLPDTATRRDLDDPMTIATVAEAVGGSVELLDLLHALAIADAPATGPAVWSDWKAGLIADLVRRARAVLGGAPLPAAPPLDDAAAPGRGRRAGGRDRRRRGDRRRAGRAGCPLPHRRRARAALAGRARGVDPHPRRDGGQPFVVEPGSGGCPTPRSCAVTWSGRSSGPLALAERLAAKERAYARGDTAGRQPPTVHWFDDAATDATVLEFRATTRSGCCTGSRPRSNAAGSTSARPGSRRSAARSSTRST